jgi:hypothetical protein
VQLGLRPNTQGQEQQKQAPSHSLFAFVTISVKLFAALVISEGNNTIVVVLFDRRFFEAYH